MSNCLRFDAATADAGRKLEVYTFGPAVSSSPTPSETVHVTVLLDGGYVALRLLPEQARDLANKVNAVASQCEQHAQMRERATAAAK